MIIAIALLEMKSYFHLVVKNLLILAHCNANFTLNSVKQMIIQSVMSMMINLLSFQFEYSSKKISYQIICYFFEKQFQTKYGFEISKITDIRISIDWFIIQTLTLSSGLISFCSFLFFSYFINDFMLVQRFYWCKQPYHCYGFIQINGWNSTALSQSLNMKYMTWCHHIKVVIGLKPILILQTNFY